MKKIRLLLALFIASISIVQNAWARTAPTMPEPQTLESGNVYYLYNVGSDRFLSSYTRTTNYSPCVWTDQGKAVKISLVNGTQYNIMFVDDNRYWDSGNTHSLVSMATSSPSSTNFLFTFTEFEGGYTIQRVYQANQEHFIGYDGTHETLIYSDLTEGNIVWQLMDADEAARYIAKRNLYRALEANTEFNIDEYEAVYENGSSTNNQLQAAADKLNNAYSITGNYSTKSWSDYPILFSSPNIDWNSGSDNFYSPQIKNGGRTTLVATIVTDEDATLVYDARTLYNKVYLDDELVAYNNNNQAIASGQNHYVEMGPGKHVIKWVFENDGSSDARGYLYNVGIEKTPTISVSLLEPGSLGTEVLKNTDHIQNVRKLVISGPMNSDDWDRIMMMTSLFTLDLTDAEITEIPQSQLSYSSHRDNLYYFHAVKLPKSLKVIGNSAFSGSDIGEIEFPDGLTTIGYGAFSGTKISQAIIPETVTSIGEYAFSENLYLNNVSYPAAAKVIPNNCFNNCQRLQPFEIPEGITSIGYRAFYECYSYRTSIPESITYIGTYAFNNCNLDNVVIREDVSMGDEPFQYSKLKTIEFPTSMYSAPYRAVRYCSSMTDIYLKSPTMVIPNGMLEGCNSSILTVHVPDYLVNTYKQDSYWYNYNIEGFSTADVDFWGINRDLTFRSGERFEGTPEVSLYNGGWLINGSDAMTISDFYNRLNIHNLSGENGMILSNCENIHIGAYEYGYYTQAKKWYFLCLPFDTKVEDIRNNANASYAIRYYDGANRAENGTGGNWKNYSKDDIIPAGTGFIFQTSKECRSYFYAQDNASKQFAFSNREFVKALAANESESTANKGWNLVGNPWQCYYNIHKLNFTAPITVWNVNNRNYTAYSIIDDDYAILPGQAFFVQCPDEINSISFPIDGRQLTDVIESQNAAPARFSVINERKLIDVEISDGNLSDKTRFVLNPEAEMEYELNRDASKFFSMDAEVPQIYTIEQGELLAINERPIGQGLVQLGFSVAMDGEYTISTSRNGFKNIILVDNETGVETDLSATESYTFTAGAGANNDRFMLRIDDSAITAIKDALTVKDNKSLTNQYYNLQGQRIVAPQKGIYIVNGKKVVVK